MRFALRGRTQEYLLVWTTTPWTLAANVAVAVNPELPYAKLRQGDAVYYLSRGRVDVVRSETAQGQTELLGEVLGRELIGWEYDGPFDELEATEEARSVHRVIGWDEVSDDSGTGIVHIAPGCGKEDFELGKEHGLPVIEAIDESGHYTGQFGFLAGKFASAVAPEVYASLRSKGLFYKAERYVHEYPHCWRCDTPLLFRAVDEWYISMSWRDEIKEMVSQIRWIPEYGRNLELDWLSNMGDWMISKKRYWGLALPIFECHECGTFDVIGSREELQQRAVEGWDEFVGDPANPNSPHRPWVDSVQVACPNCGRPASRIPDVGNPWLDAGIVACSTVAYNSDRDYWSKWIPADLVLECFPGQFRNWFYALLAMSTMMEQIAPFRTLFGHALVRDEHGEEMHKSKGNAIWFDEAVEKMGADCMRWIYCRQNPLQNLNFGYKVGKQVERKLFGTLWNTYAFFANYARLDEFDPYGPTVPPTERPEIDRWILSDLQLLVRSARLNIADYSLAPVMRQAEDFIEKLSNWYVRRNRRRFWRSRGEDDRDKLAAYHTLYEVLVTLSKVLAPVIPFVTERLYQGLVCAPARSRQQKADPLPGPAPESVHLCDYPEVDPTLIDQTLSDQMQLVLDVVSSGHALREQAGQRVRQPLAELRIEAPQKSQREAIERLEPLITDELNVKQLVRAQTLDDLVWLAAKPNFSQLGPRYGKDLPKLTEALTKAPQELLSQLQSGQSITLQADGQRFELAPGDVSIEPVTQEGWLCGPASDLRVALDTRITPKLLREGLARDVVRHIQQLRKQMGLDIADRIELGYRSDDPDLGQAISEWAQYICAETLCDQLQGDCVGEGAKEVALGKRKLWLELRKR